MDFKKKYKKYKIKNQNLGNLINELSNNISKPKNTASNTASNTATNTASNNYFYNKSLQRYGDLAKFGLKYKCDKATHHKYYEIYPIYLEIYRNLQNKAMLEIGMDKKRSLYMWLDYFKYAHIYGLDIGFEDNGERHNIYQADQSNTEQLDSVKNKIIQQNKEIFFIIDDGSHICEHQIKTFNLYFEHLLMYGGTYIIEDIEVNYWTHGDLYGYNTNYGYKHNNSLVEYFKCIADDINSEFMTPENKKKQEDLIGSIIPFSVRQLIKLITFGKNCIIILKNDHEKDNRTYRFYDKL
jgi:hypothetical protein